jgi:hypothetical protein
MNNPKGLSLGTKYDFDAWAEEDATVYSGESWVQKTSQWQGRETSQILNQFKNSRYITWLNLKGEIMGTHSPAEGVRTELVATLAEAAGPVPIKNKSLITLFGYIPQGLNDLNRSTNTPATPTPKQGLPPKGQRIFIKSQPLGKTPPTGIPSQNEEHGGANSAVQSNDNKDAQ